MAKKESNNKTDLEGKTLKNDISSGGHPSFLSGKVFGIVKFILGICLLPFVYSISVSFLGEIGLIQKAMQDYFWGGLIAFLVIYLFVWEPVLFYTRGHKILELVFSFFKPIVKVAPYLLPIYTIVLFILYAILYIFLAGSRWLLPVFIFLCGFSIALHLVFSAKTIRLKKGDFLKSNYIFGFSIIYIINVMILGLGLSLIFKEFSFVNFFNVAFQTAKGIFLTVLKQLF